MNLFDKALTTIAPGMALKRAVARKQIEVVNGTGYGYGNYGANSNRKAQKRWFWQSRSPKEDLDLNHDELMQKARDLYYGTTIGNGALKTIRTNVVGVGLKCRPNIDAEFLGMTEDQAAEWERNVMREFKLWAESTNCDAERINNFYELQQLAFLSWIMNGDVFATLPFKQRPNMPYDLRIQLIEADRVCNPNNNVLDEKITEGVERDSTGEVVAYHICNEHPKAFTGKQKTWTRVKAYGSKTGRRNVLHCMSQERIGQSRGVPLLAPVIETVKQLGRYTDAELMSAVVSGMFTVFIKQASISNDKPFGEENEIYDEEDAQDEISLGNGAVVGLQPGEDVEFANPNRANTGFEAFVNALCRQIGASLELPVELLLKQFTSSYSASRGALLEAWKTFKMYRGWLSNDFCQPIYEEWLTEAVVKGRILAPGFTLDSILKKAYCNCSWNGPAQGTLDPTKEVQAAQQRVENGFTTRQQETIELGGGDFFDNNRQRIREEIARQQIPNSGIQTTKYEEKEGDNAKED